MYAIRSYYAFILSPVDIPIVRAGMFLAMKAASSDVLGDILGLMFMCEIICLAEDASGCENSIPPGCLLASTFRLISSPVWLETSEAMFEICLNTLDTISPDSLLISKRRIELEAMALKDFPPSIEPNAILHLGRLGSGISRMRFITSFIVTIDPTALV